MNPKQERAQCEATLRLVLTLASKLCKYSELNQEQSVYVVIQAYLSGARFSDILDRIEGRQSLSPN